MGEKGAPALPSGNGRCRAPLGWGWGWGPASAQGCARLLQGTPGKHLTRKGLKWGAVICTPRSHNTYKTRTHAATHTRTHARMHQHKRTPAPYLWRPPCTACACVHAHKPACMQTNMCARTHARMHTATHLLCGGHQVRRAPARVLRRDVCAGRQERGHALHFTCARCPVQGGAQRLRPG